MRRRARAPAAGARPLGLCLAVVGCALAGGAAEAQRAPGRDSPDPSSISPGPTRSTRGVFERTVVEVNPVGPAITRLEIDNRLGDVRVEGHDSSLVVVSAVKRARDYATLDRLKVTLLSDPSGPVRISTRIAESVRTAPIPGGSIRIDLIIRTPRGAEVAARVWNDDLEIIGMDNGADLTANEGDIAVKNVSGTVVTRSSAGKQNFVDVFGAVDAQAITGEMELVIVRGRRLDASLHKGTIAGRQVRVQEMSLRTTEGDIFLEGYAVAGGRYRIASYRGNIEVKLRHGAALSVSARSRQGQVILPSRLRTRPDDHGALVGLLPAVIPGQRNRATAVVELRSHVGNLQFAVVE